MGEDNPWLTPVADVWGRVVGAAGDVFTRGQKQAEAQQIRERSLAERVGLTNLLLVGAGIVALVILWRRYGR